MHLYSVAGTFGAGKTTLITATVRANPGRYAYVLNDDGAEVDGSMAADAAAVVTMTNGCFTCADEEDLAELLATLARDNFQGAFVEGFGMVSGVETRSFLERSGYPFSIFALLDFEHFARNQARYGELVATHISAATAGIGITRFPASVADLGDSVLQEVLEFIEHRAHGVPVMLMGKDDVLPVDDWHGTRFSCTHAHHVHDANCGHSGHTHHHHSHHGHAHGHGMQMIPYSFNLPSDTTLGVLQGALRVGQEEGSIVRVKGALGGRKFDAVFQDWSEGPLDERSFVTIYASRHVDFATELPLFTALSRERPRAASEAESHELIRQDNVNPEETVRQIRALIAEMPERATTKETPAGIRLVTHPEDLQMLKEIARRPSVEREWFPQAIEACMRYWVDAGEYLRTNEHLLVASELPYNQRELGVSLTWWARKGEGYLPPVLFERVTALKPAEMVAHGVLALTRLNTNPVRAYWQAEEIRTAALFGKQYGEDLDLIRRALVHAAGLAKTSAQQEQWASVTAEFA